MLSYTSSPRTHDSLVLTGFKYANEQPEMCRFLLQRGVDVDHVTPKRGDSDWPISTALMQMSNDFEAGEQELRRNLECRKLLLQAVCDPS